MWSRSSTSGIDEVLVVSSASCFIFGSSVWYSARLASGFSMMASITRSASATPLPSRSARRRAATAGRLLSSRTFLANSACARSMAGSMKRCSRSCRVTSKPL
ncbi:hypothetical protein G6F63_016358 [Rhizopus arrhizus]|nr:hypothetical protein G6F63_016358 [Rhizopus arrhizus]